MRAAIYNGLLNGVANPKSLDVVPSCSSGNCSFPHEYTSLAVCSSCTDITKFVNFPTGPNSRYPNGLITDDFRNAVATLPNGLVLLLGTTRLNSSASLPDVVDMSTIYPKYSSLGRFTLMKLPIVANDWNITANQCELVSRSCPAKTMTDSPC